MLCRAVALISLSLLVVGVSLIAAPQRAHAQAFAFSIGSGGGGHHHHHHNCRGGWWAGYGIGPYWGPGYYAPPAVVYAPPPVVQERVIYVQPNAPAALPPVTPYSATPSAPPAALAANTIPSVAGSTQNDDRIVIRNAAGAKLPVSFLVDGQDVELADGSTRTFVGKTQRSIQYDRGGRYGSTQQDLTGGQYEFRVTASGWDLVRRPDILSSRTAIRANSLPDSSVAR